MRFVLEVLGEGVGEASGVDIGASGGYGGRNDAMGGGLRR